MSHEVVVLEVLRLVLVSRDQLCLVLVSSLNDSRTRDETTSRPGNVAYIIKKNSCESVILVMFKKIKFEIEDLRLRLGCWGLGLRLWSWGLGFILRYWGLGLGLGLSCSGLGLGLGLGRDVLDYNAVKWIINIDYSQGCLNPWNWWKECSSTYWNGSKSFGNWIDK